MLKIKSVLKKIGKMFVFFIKTVQFLTFAAIIALAVFLWQKPQYLVEYLQIEEKNDKNTEVDDKNNDILLQNSAKIEYLDKKVENLEDVGRVITENSDLLKQQFAYFDKSKADAAELLNISNSINSLNNKINKIGAVSNSGALILTAAMLIRENIFHGQSCQNEAEALKILAENIESMNENVEFIVSNSTMNFYSQGEIISQFNNIFKSLKKTLYTENYNDWKQRLINKINEYVKISNPQDEENEKEIYNPRQALKDIKQYVDKGDLTAAMRLIKSNENKQLAENNQIKDWYNQIEKQAEFYKALSNIITQSLLIMKVENAAEKPQ